MLWRTYFEKENSTHVHVARNHRRVYIKISILPLSRESGSVRYLRECECVGMCEREFFLH